MHSLVVHGTPVTPMGNLINFTVKTYSFWEFGTEPLYQYRRLRWHPFSRYQFSESGT